MSTCFSFDVFPFRRRVTGEKAEYLAAQQLTSDGLLGPGEIPYEVVFLNSETAPPLMVK